MDFDNIVELLICHVAVVILINLLSDCSDHLADPIVAGHYFDQLLPVYRLRVFWLISIEDGAVVACRVYLILC